MAHIGKPQTHYTLSSMCLPDLIYISFFFFILSVEAVWIFLLTSYHGLFQYLGNVYFIFSYVFRDKTGLSNEYVLLFTRGAFPKIKNVCEEAKAIVKIEAVLFIIFKPNYRDLI